MYCVYPCTYVCAIYVYSCVVGICIYFYMCLCSLPAHCIHLQSYWCYLLYIHMYLVQHSTGTVYSETSSIQQSMGPENNIIGLGGC